MPDAVELVKTIKRAAIEAVESEKPVEVCFGVVTSASPLKILVEQKMTLGSAQLVLCRNVTDHTVEMTVNHYTENALNMYSHSHNYSGSTENSGEPEHNHLYSGQTESNNKDFAHNHAYKGRKKFTVHNGLVVGDEVILLRQQGGQKYIVVDKIG